MSERQHFGVPLTGKAAERHFQRNEILMEFSELFDCAEASDRAVAIVRPAFLDSLLAGIITEFMVDDEAEVAKLMQPEGPLGTYGSRVTACFCLGPIGPIIKADLKLVGKIRNFFAHDIRASFSNQKVSQWCRSLRWHKDAMFLHETPSEATDRDLFQVGVNQLVSYLNGVPGIGRSQKCSRVAA